MLDAMGRAASNIHSQENIMNFRRLGLSAFALCSVALLGPMSGCTAGPVDSDEDTVDEESVAEAESAFGETACGTDWSSPDVTLTNGWPQQYYAWQSYASLPYGDSTCTQAFRVLHQYYPYSGCTFKAKFKHDSSVSLPTTQQNCEASYVESITYDSSGNAIGSPSYAYGIWQPAGVCSLPGTTLNSNTTSSSANGMKLGTAVAKIASCYTDPVQHKVFCFYTQDGVQTLTSCPAP